MWTTTGYQFYAPDAFGNYNVNRALTIDDGYVDSVSITYGTAPRKHIWTYANGNYLGNGNTNCPCYDGSSAIPPPYVGSDYYCETGNNMNSLVSNILYSNDPLHVGWTAMSWCGGSLLYSPQHAMVY